MDGGWEMGDERDVGGTRCMKGASSRAQPKGCLRKHKNASEESGQIGIQDNEIRATARPPRDFLAFDGWTQQLF